MIDIVQKENPVLRQKAEPVLLDEITSPKIKQIIAEMKAALAACDDGVGIAAPQIGVSLQIFVVSGKVFAARAKDTNKEYPDMTFINPSFTKLSSKKKTMDEGCLSVRWIYGQVKRAEKATVEAYDEAGKKFTKSGSGFLAQIFQHEIDHLEGTLFIDKASNLQEITPEHDQ